MYLYVSVLLLALKSIHCGLLPNAEFPANFTWKARPTIGILAQEIGPRFPAFIDYSYIAASYVKYVESAGAMVIPVRLNQTDEYYQRVFSRINGLLLPGGEANVEDSEYQRVAGKFFNWSIISAEENKSFPIFGICLGFEQLLQLVSGDNPLSACDPARYHTSVTLRGNWNSSFLVDDMPFSLLEQITTENITMNAHEYCLSLEDYEKNEKIRNFFDVFATSKDPKDKVFAAYIQAKNYPIFGVQWHPEKAQYEWKIEMYRHDPQTVAAGQYLINRFVKLAHENENFVTLEDLDLLIYSYTPEFAMPHILFMQTYMFKDFAHKQTTESTTTSHRSRQTTESTTLSHHIKQTTKSTTAPVQFKE